MKCPVCKAELVRAGESAYETLSEHVCDPNNTDRTKKPRFKCPNRCYPRRVFFGIEGGVYVPPTWIQKHILWALGIYGWVKSPKVEDAILDY